MILLQSRHTYRHANSMVKMDPKCGAGEVLAGFEAHRLTCYRHGQITVQNAVTMSPLMTSDESTAKMSSRISLAGEFSLWA
jgi:ribosomal protein S27AE